MFLILIVLYNKTISTSATLQGILESAGLLNKAGAKLLLWDNSFEKMKDDEVNQLEHAIVDVDYRHTSANLPLSEIYNETIQELKKAEYSYLVLLDDDSKIDKNYFIKAFEGAEENHSLMIPVVKNQGIIRSPMYSYIIKASILSNVPSGNFPSKNLMAINSGMIISSDFLKATGFQYDTRLRNYSTDSYFMKFYSSKCKQLYILDYAFEHSLSFFDTGDMKRRLEIFQQSKKSFLILHSDNLFNLAMAMVYNLMSSIKNAVKYKTLKFFK